MSDMTARFVTADLGGMHARCPSCRRHRPGSDFLRDETRCRDCDAGAYDRALAAEAARLEARRARHAPPPRRLVPRAPRAAVRERIARHLGADPGDLEAD